MKKIVQNIVYVTIFVILVLIMVLIIYGIYKASIWQYTESGIKFKAALGAVVMAIIVIWCTISTLVTSYRRKKRKGK